MAFLSGWRLYVALGLVAAFIGLGGYAAFERQSAIAAHAERDTERERVKRVTSERDDAIQRLTESEVEKAELVKRQEDTDAIVAAQRQHERKLEDEKALIWTQFDKLAKTLPQADQDCIARRIPDSVLEWLRDDGPADPDSIPKGPNPERPPA